MKIAIIIKTYNEARVLDRCLECLKRQVRPADWIVVLDAGSQDTAYVRKYQGDPAIDVRLDPENLGFCVGNNLAVHPYIDRADYVMFLNPDAFLPPEFLAQLETLLDRLKDERVGVIGPRLRRYDLARDAATDVLDTTGIFHRWYGHWYDRGQGEVDDGRFARQPVEAVPAICGAAMICSTAALKATALSPGEYFRASFFMYKDDIDLSFRVGRSGFQVLYAGQLLAYHCRGWRRRGDMPKRFRLMSARNEIVINSQIGLVPWLYSRVKLAAAQLGL